MAVDTRYDPDTNTLTILVTGSFDYSVQSFFCDAIERLSETMEFVDIDLRAAIHMDSAALGMLLVLLDKANDNQKIRLLNAKREVRKTLEIANFDQLFLML